MAKWTKINAGQLIIETPPDQDSEQTPEEKLQQIREEKLTLLLQTEISEEELIWNDFSTFET